jgi:mitogen-activated protein kinase kinase kinase 4
MVSFQHEMIIFMEYCSHGTIEEAARQGLSEDMIRRYTKDILIAIDVLHEHHIVHRDIKGLFRYCLYVTI